MTLRAKPEAGARLPSSENKYHQIVTDRCQRQMITVDRLLDEAICLLVTNSDLKFEFIGGHRVLSFINLNQLEIKSVKFFVACSCNVK